jgi:D-arabinose 1-dehydrogenase-like Zn-dependent alcohol dehydrogenase
LSPKALKQVFGCLRRGGTAVFVGLPADQYLQLSILSIESKEWKKLAKG